MQLTRHSSRGQAVVETALFLPVFLLVFWAVIWAVQTSVANERLQSAVRYSGLISSDINPYLQYSLFSIYDNLGSNVGVVPQPCSTPNTDALSNANTFPGPASGVFWQPQSNSIQSTCVGAQVSLTGSSLARTELFMNNNAQLSAKTTVPQLLSAFLGKSTSIAAQQNFLRGPDVGTIVHCYPELNAAISASLRPLTAPSPSAVPTPLPNTLPTTALAVAQSCST